MPLPQAEETAMTAPTLNRNATMQDLIKVLRDQQARKLDVVVPASTPRFANNNLVLPIGEAELTEDGVTSLDGVYRVTDVFDQGASTRLNVPAGYLGRIRDISWAPDHIYGQGGNTLYDHTLNALLANQPEETRYLLRLFRSGEPDQDGYVGVARAMLTDSYKPIDHLDSLMAMLSGVRAAGVTVDIDSADLTDSRMYVRVACPQVAVLAPKLVEQYRSPFDHGIRRAGGWTLERAREAAGREGLGYEPGDEPVVFSGFIFKNSETGQGRFTIEPVAVIRVCRNGLTLPVGGMQRQHLGAKLDEGVWSDDTREKNLSLIAAQARDTVTAILDEGYLTAQVRELEKVADAPVSDAAETIKIVRTKLQFNESLQDSLLEHYMVSGQKTAAGIANAMTSLAQTVEDADLADRLQGKAVAAMHLVASMAAAGN
jgi:hypothetical protein